MNGQPALNMDGNPAAPGLAESPTGTGHPWAVFMAPTAMLAALKDWRILRVSSDPCPFPRMRLWKGAKRRDNRA